ncbi:hypothetical protein DFH06DRAFT_1003163 [Mycena polygramma]|nr:hypothetical protein DFH06DRAFT_1012248 [Mycena polygramma]KAJ7635790.1 hypothetical protein DFH06DRAFT_1003163 [Mycena polygramma]
MDNSYKELLIFDSDSGWTRNNAGGQMFWVPPWLRDGLYLRHNTLVLSERATTKLDLSQLVHGTEWTQCVDVNFTTNRIK